MATLALMVIAAGFMYEIVQSEMQRRVLTEIAQSGPSGDPFGSKIELDELPAVEEVTLERFGRR